MTITEAAIEQQAIVWLTTLGYTHLDGAAIAPGEPAAERQSLSDVFLRDRLQRAIATLNHELPAALHHEALVRITTPSSGNLLRICQKTFL
jgi:type I restriction enzyme R subunit